MRRVSRPVPIPGVLQSPEYRQAAKELIAFLRRPSEERVQRSAPFNEKLFYDSRLTEHLASLFRNKCAFCETPVQGLPPVRHFRPLQFAEPAMGRDTELYYSWLAYEWQNLLLVCDHCDKAKSTRFPLQEGNRATWLARIDAVHGQEYPLLLDPCVDNPRPHLQFFSNGLCAHKTVRGAVTIDVLQLNRIDLAFARRQAIERWTAHLQDEWDLDALVETLWPAENDTSFSLDAPHLAASVDVLRRILVEWRGASPNDVAQLDGFLRNTAAEIRDSNKEQRQALINAVKNLQVNDEARTQVQRAATARAARFEVTPRPRPALREPDAAVFEIDTIRVENVKAIDRLDISLPVRRGETGGVPCLTILGENSTGKSTLLSAIALALIGSQQSRRLKLKPADLLSSVRTDSIDQLDAPEAKVTVSFHLSDTRATFRMLPDGGIEGSQHPAKVVLAYGPRRYVSPRQRNRLDGAFRRVKTLFDPLATIPYPNDWLAGLSDDRFGTVARALRIVLSLNDADELVNDTEFGMCVLANGRLTPVDRLSEGYKSVFALVVDICRELLDHNRSIEQASGVVLIDEIETHLHPRWKMQIMTSLRRVFPRVQFIVTTHDPLCLRGMDDGEVVVLQRVADAKIRPVANLPSVKGMSAEQLLISDYFGLSSTADPATAFALAKITADVVTRTPDGETVVQLSAETEKLVKNLSPGNSPTEEVMQEALERFLVDREVDRGALRSDVREEAIEAVLKALTSPSAA